MSTDFTAIIQEMDSSETIEVYHWIPHNKNKWTQEVSTEWVLHLQQWLIHEVGMVYQFDHVPAGPRLPVGFGGGGRGLRVSVHLPPPPAGLCGVVLGTLTGHHDHLTPDLWETFIRLQYWTKTIVQFITKINFITKDQ